MCYVMKRKSMKKCLIIIVSFLIVITIMLNNRKETEVCINNHCFNVEIAESKRERSKGLMFRKNLDPNKGMIFLHNDEEVISISMKNTLIPLDVIWIDREKKIIHIEKNLQPCISDPCESFKQTAKYVLEINVGKADEYSIKVGDDLTFINISGNI